MKNPRSAIADTVVKSLPVDPFLYLHTQKLAQAVISGMKVAAAIEVSRLKIHQGGRK